ncbi:MAG: prephenate dehydratase [Thermoplasmataceae archaeon]
MQKTVSYLGPDGSWSEICSLVWFKGYARLPCRSFDEALDMVEVGKSDVCVIPVENSIEGPVTQVLDILSDSSLNIIGEKIMKIRHCLLSNSGEIKVVYSHPQALAQCRKKLRAMLPGADIVPVSSTSEKWVEASEGRGVAIIGSPDLAARYGLTIVSDNVCDYDFNLTRFIAVGRSTEPSGEKSKASINFSPSSNRPGSLVSVLKPLSDRGINMSMVVSRPDKKHAGSYRFFIDCDSFGTIENLNAATEEMKGEGAAISIKGIYCRSSWEMPDYP